MSKQSWLSFIPAHTAHDLAAAAGDLIGRERRLHAVTLFADVSGFTAISEALGRAGKSGTEELTRILNSYFEPMIALIEVYGGIVGKFGGDAMTVLFPYLPDDPDARFPGEAEALRPLLHNADAARMTSAARRAVCCALAMQRDMTRYAAIRTSAGPFALAMKAGLAAGAVYAVNVGDASVGGRVEFVIAGEAIDACSDAEHHAERGEVVVQDALLPLLNGLAQVAAREGFTVVSGDLPDAAPAPLPAPPPLSEAALDDVARFIPPTVAGRLAAGREEFIDEHRRVTVLFMRFANFDYAGDPQVGARLGAYLGQVTRIVARYGGLLNKVDMGDKGSKAIIVFGAPVAYEDDAQRALRCALALSALPGMPVSLGINSGLVYCGRVGSRARREYTVMGDAVNLSARLMQYAQPGQIIVSAATQQAAPGFGWQALPAITVKGKTEPITIYALHSAPPAVGMGSGGLREPVYKLPMVGRAAELGMIEDKLTLAQGGSGQIVGVVAEAGMGKSRLVAEAIRSARARGMRVYGGAAQSYNADLPYVVWMTIWRDLFSLDAAQPPDAQIAALEAALSAIDPALRVRLPLVGPVVGLTIPDNAMTRVLEAGLRAELLHALLLICLAHASAPSDASAPLLIVLEDCHWIDPASRALTEYLGRNLARLPVLLLMAYRPPVEEHLDRDFAFMLPAMRFGHFTELRLGRFSADEAAVLVMLKLAQTIGQRGPLPPSVLERVLERAEGNPFYIDELVNLMHDQGVDPHDDDALERMALPDSLQSLILSRIDRLTENEQIILKVASVIGRVFRASWIPGSYPEAGATPEVFIRLGRLSDLELTPLDRPEPELEYLFKHVLTQEVAYESMAYATRASLHERVGLFIEGRYADALDDYVHLLAFHFGRTADTERQRRYFRLAGDAARRAYANQAAVRYYTALTPLLTDDPATRIDVLVSLAAVQQVMGRWDEAEAHLRAALADAGALSDGLRAAQAHVALGDLLAYSGDPDDALAHLRAAFDGFRRQEDAAGLSRALRHLSYVAFRQGDYATARQYAEQHLALSAQADAPAETGQPAGDYSAHHNLGLIDWYTGDLAGALRHFEEARAAAERTGDQQSLIYALNNISGLHFAHNEYAQAMQVARAALEQASAIGYLRVVGLVLVNLGSLYLECSREDDALLCYRAGLRLALEIGDRLDTPITLRNIALALYRQGDLALAAAALTRATALATAIQARDVLGQCLLDQARLRAAADDFTGALAALHETEQLALELGQDDLLTQARAYRPLIAVRARQMRPEAALTALDDLLNEADAAHHALIYDQQWQLDPTDDSALQAAVDGYRDLYASFPQAEAQRRYQALTGRALIPPDLPAPPPVALRHQLPLPALLEQFDRVLLPG